ncbi:class I SAM-dependent methyltransferase [Anaeromusa sp.]|uniref:class I SAM-dependent methyltransferase n=1 Tax=Anaeromusa sp. TaxID=1872520 RepID=UPI00262F640D|nr:class I SAM-dependent methyltransferase [Anaeromusa sp.]MDD3157966.1 class I SAM-dependent methyltransferase [Anaeromusa sp.]
MDALTAIFSIFAALCCIWVVWKLVSRRKSLPCPSWLYRMVEMENPLAKNSQAKTILAGLGVAEGMTVLDAGCGPGRVTLPLAKAVGADGKVIAVDLQQGMLDVVQRKAQQENFTMIEFAKLPLGEGKLPAYQADRAVMAAVLGEIPQQAAALQEVFAALKPGGVLAIAETIFDPHYQRKAHVLDLAQAAGFAEVGFTGNALAYTVYLQKP